MASETKTTTNHGTIKKWVEARGGKPSSVKSTRSDDDAGLLRIDFPGYEGEGSLEEIPWNEFFKKFDEKKLAFLYQEKTVDNEESRFCKFVSRETAESKGHNLKADEKAHKAENKGESKAHNLKADEKAHKAEQKTSEKTHSRTHK